MAIYDEFLKMDFPRTNEEEFQEFVKSLPSKHWSKYDLSAVRLGWEAQKTLEASKRG